MGKIKSFIFSNDNQCDTVDKNIALTEEDFTFGLSTFDTILPPAFTDSNGVEHRLYDRGIPFAFQKVTRELIEKFRKESKENLKYDSHEIKKMEDILSNKEDNFKTVSDRLIKELRKCGLLPVYHGTKFQFFRRMQIETWYKKPYAHTPRVNHELIQGIHAKNTFGDKERKREFSFALAGFMFGVLLILAIVLPVITGLIAQIG